MDGEETFFVSFQTAETGNRTPNSGVKGSGANHYPRAPAPLLDKIPQITKNKNTKAVPQCHLSRIVVKHDAQNQSNHAFLLDNGTMRYCQLEHVTCYNKGSYIEVYHGIEFPKHDFQFNHDTIAAYMWSYCIIRDSYIIMFY